MNNIDETKLLRVIKNKIHVNVNYFRKIVVAKNYDIIIECFVKINYDVLKKYDNFNYYISVESIQMSDLMYYDFFEKLVQTVQTTFTTGFGKIYLTDTSIIFYNIFPLIKIFIDKEILNNKLIIS